MIALEFSAAVENHSLHLLSPQLPAEIKRVKLIVMYEENDVLPEKPPVAMRMGDALSALGKQAGLSNQDVEILTQNLDQKPAEPMELP